MTLRLVIPASQCGSLIGKAGTKIKEIREVFDYSDAGGAPILGLKGSVLKIHGNSKATEVYHAIHRAVDYVDSDITGMISEAVSKSDALAGKGEE